MNRSVALLLLMLGMNSIAGQIGEIESRLWTARWIDVPGAPPQQYGVYHFRRTFELAAKPQQFVVHVSGDNRYQLLVNGTRVSWGPARGDLTHWRYETLDIAPWLRAGKNVLAAVVWNDGPYRAVAQITNQTGFLLQAAQPEDQQVNSSRDWKCMQDKAYTPQPLPPDQMTGYYALAANEHVDGAQYPWGWESSDFNDSSWLPAHELSHAASRYARDAPNRWMLVESQIPLEEETPERLQRVRSTEGPSAPDAFLRGAAAVNVPANTTATLLLDQSYLTTAYPELEVSSGRGARVDLRYAETLYVRKGLDKGNRNEIEGKKFYGPADTFVSEGGEHRVYRPLFWRTYRYIQLTVKTADEPLVIDDLRAIFTGYPFKRKASFESTGAAQNPELQQILFTGWRTARLCAHETYMDCPFYEQLQYAGDARIQMLVSLYMTGDARLMKNGIALLDSSRTAEGATYSRAPSNLQQYIPPFSLWWIGMLHDYWMYVDDVQFVKQMLPGMRAVLQFYENYRKPNGSLQHMPWWNFVDWVKQWKNGEPPAEPDGSSAAALDLQLLLAYRWAADLEQGLGDRALADEDASAAEHLKAAILTNDWEPARGLFADQPSHQTYSQQVNTLAVLAHVVSGAEAGAIMRKVISDPTLAQSSIYFRAYTNAALREVGMGDLYLSMLEPWRQMLSQGLTTWSEVSGPDSRSDCHAWGASPNFELFRTVAGIEPMAPEFARVRVAPNLGSLAHVTAQMPHPKGTIRVEFERRDGALLAEIELPAGVSGELDWGNRQVMLQAGKNSFRL